MGYTLADRNSVLTRVKDVMNAPFRMLSAGVLSVMTGIMATCPTLCAKIIIDQNTDMDTLFGNFIELMIKLAFYIGVLALVGGFIAYLLAQKDDDSRGQNMAIKAMVIGGALVGFRGLLALAGIIQG